MTYHSNFLKAQKEMKQKKKIPQKSLVNKICSEIAYNEGKKHQASIGDIREIISLVSYMMVSDVKIVQALIESGFATERRQHMPYEFKKKEPKRKSL